MYLTLKIMANYKVVFKNCPTRIVWAYSNQDARRVAAKETRGYLPYKLQLTNIISCKKIKDE